MPCGDLAVSVELADEAEDAVEAARVDRNFLRLQCKPREMSDGFDVLGSQAHVGLM